MTNDIFCAIRSYIHCLHGQGIHPTDMQIWLSNGKTISCPIPDPNSPVFLPKSTEVARPKTLRSKKTGARRGPGFRSVNWYGTVYNFTPQQAAIVALLWKAWKNGTPDLPTDFLLRKSGSEAGRLPDLFRDHPAWEVLIVTGQTKGTYRLQKPA